jgi:hypothetical protein
MTIHAAQTNCYQGAGLLWLVVLFNVGEFTYTWSTFGAREPDERKYVFAWFAPKMGKSGVSTATAAAWQRGDAGTKSKSLTIQS